MNRRQLIRCIKTNQRIYFIDKTLLPAAYSIIWWAETCWMKWRWIDKKAILQPFSCLVLVLFCSPTVSCFYTSVFGGWMVASTFCRFVEFANSNRQRVTACESDSRLIVSIFCFDCSCLLVWVQYPLHFSQLRLCVMMKTKDEVMMWCMFALCLNTLQ